MNLGENQLLEEANRMQDMDDYHNSQDEGDYLKVAICLFFIAIALLIAAGWLL